MERLYATNHYLLIVTDMLYCTVSELQQIIVHICVHLIFFVTRYG